MKNIFKFMGIALMATSLLVACNKDKEEENNNNQQQQEEQNVVKVTFDGTEWTAGAKTVNYMEAYGAMQFTAYQTAQNLPFFDEAIYTAEVGSVTDAAPTGQFGEESTHVWVEYYEQTYLQDGSGNRYGDWWAETATTNIKAIDLTALTVTAEMEGTFFSALEAFVPASEDQDPAGLTDATSRAAYKATFSNVTVSAN